MQKKYQIFVGSTYKDLIEERICAINSIMKLQQIPAGMEYFGAMGEKQIPYIKKIIDESDYYLLIVGGKYGSLNEYGLSYTESEFDYAVDKGIKVIAFLIKDESTLPNIKCEHSKKIINLLCKFRNKVEKNGLVVYWENKDDLENKISTSLANVMRDYPAVGWVRSNDFDEQIDASKDELVCLFPEVKNIKIGKPQINYNTNNPSKAVVICEDEYVQILARDGRVENHMIDVCLDYIRLLKDRSEYFEINEMVCLRNIWFNTISPEVIISLDYMYEERNTKYSIDEIKKMFYDLEIFDGICYCVQVRKLHVNFWSDHFYKNNREFYDKEDGTKHLNINWELTTFQYDKSENNKILGSIKVTNQNKYPVKFKILGEFEMVLDGNHTKHGIKLIEPIIATYNKNEDILELLGHESKLIQVNFKSVNSKINQIPFDVKFESLDIQEDYV